jgi:hypothetical protein
MVFYGHFTAWEKAREVLARLEHRRAGISPASRTKKKAARRSAPPLVILRSGLEGLDVRGLQALRSFGDLEFNRLAVIQRLIAISHNRGEMYENIFSTLALDETEALAGVKPLHCSLFFTHCVTLFCQPGCG